MHFYYGDRQSSWSTLPTKTTSCRVGPRSSTRQHASAAMPVLRLANPKTMYRLGFRGLMLSPQTWVYIPTHFGPSRSRAAINVRTRLAPLLVRLAPCIPAQMGSSISIRTSASVARPASRPAPTTQFSSTPKTILRKSAISAHTELIQAWSRPA